MSFHPFGVAAYCINSKPQRRANKLAPTSREAIFIGTTSPAVGLLIDTLSGKQFEHCLADCKFNDNFCPSWPQLLLSKHHDVFTPTHPSPINTTIADSAINEHLNRMQQFSTNPLDPEVLKLTRNPTAVAAAKRAVNARSAKSGANPDSILHNISLAGRWTRKSNERAGGYISIWGYEPHVTNAHKPIIPTPKPLLPRQDPDIDYLQLTLNARVYDVASETDLHLASKLSAKLGNQVFLKREDTQPIFSFKIRGAYNRIYHLTKKEKDTGIICASAGNHAQGVALAAKKLGIKATIVMPKHAPSIKVESVRRLGAQVVLHGADFDEAKKECARLKDEMKLIYIPPFDDPYVIAGQGTIGVEILRQLKQDRLDAIFVCCGGGGLLAGISAFVKRIRPEVKIIGVNSEDSDGMFQSLHKGQPTEIPTAGLFADGTSVRLCGTENFRLCRSFVDDFVLVSTDEICAAIKDTFDDTRSIIEPSGALAVAGVKKFCSQNPQFKNAVFVAVVSGANMNFDRLRFVAERARLGDGKEILLSIKIPERPGSFLDLYSVIDPKPVTEFSYRFSDTTTARVFIALETTDPTADSIEIIEKLRQNEMEALDVTNNEMAKTHLRYLAGGRSATVQDEVLYRFQFPERPGALKRFLNQLKGKWNISLFHYRNHGADIARVLVGMQVAVEERGTTGNTPAVGAEGPKLGVMLVERGGGWSMPTLAMTLCVLPPPPSPQVPRLDPGPEHPVGVDAGALKQVVCKNS
ncbi:hypothetical protein HDU98_001111, partial [Podochytrium sp. JEL0797]